MNAIQTEDLRKTYGAVKALDGLSLSIEPGVVFGFLGPNGAGKTTTIRLLCGLARPTSGSGSVAGIPISDQRRLSKKIGYLPEDPSFYTWMTPVEFLDHVGRAFGLSSGARKERVKSLLEQADLASVRNRRIAGFSRGMRQRLGLAQAFINYPEVLLLDEPASALDPAGRKEVLDLIESLRGQTTVFMSTHILADVERVCDTIGIIDQGRLVVEARQDELLARYTIPAFELECEPGQEDPLAAWVATLPELAWVESTNMEATTARVVVKDLQVARQELLRLAAESGVILRRYEIVTPSLEDVFLRLVGQQKEAVL